jgi:hypothetical protein
VTEYPSCPLPLHPEEVVRARAEDPAFAEVLGRARAKARGVEYDPTIHHPNAPRSGIHDRVKPEHEAAAEALRAEWETRGGGRRNPYLELMR